VAMTTLTVRNLPEDAKHRFRQVAAAHGRSMEEHLRQLIIEAGYGDDGARGVADRRAAFDHAPVDARAESRARIERLIALGRGLDWEPEPRDVGEMRDIDFG